MDFIDSALNEANSGRHKNVQHKLRKIPPLVTAVPEQKEKKNAMLAMTLSPEALQPALLQSDSKRKEQSSVLFIPSWIIAKL